MNTLKLTFLMALMTVLFVVIGGMIGGEGGALLALLIAGGMNFFSYWNSDKIVLKMHGAQEVDEAQAPDLHYMVRNLAQRAQLPMPKVYIIDTPMANAFATGRDPEHGAVALTTGIMESLSAEELEGVVAHELGHIKNRDILISTIAATMAGAISFIAQIGQFSLFFGGGDDEDGGNPLLAIAAIILMPIAAMLIQMAISRSREYGADAAAAQLTRNPLALASALQRLEQSADRQRARLNPATSHLFIVNPLRGGFASLFSTHPPTAERIARLQNLAFQRQSR